MWFLSTKIESNENENQFFCLIFLDKVISVTNEEIIMNFSGVILHVPFEGSVSQIFYLGPRFYSMLRRK